MPIFSACSTSSDVTAKHIAIEMKQGRISSRIVNIIQYNARRIARAGKIHGLVISVPLCECQVKSDARVLDLTDPEHPRCPGYSL